MPRLLGLLLLLALHTAAGAAERAVAITIDDLPRGGDSQSERSLAAVKAMTAKLLTPFREQQVPVVGFVNEGRSVAFGAEGLREVLELWLDAGADLGNHSYSHLNINRVSLEQYTADVTRGEPLVRAALAARGRELRYFRHPFLFTGPTPEIKTGMQAFLDAEGYVVAPVTFDNSDYMFASLYTQPELRERVRQAYVPYMESVVASFEAASVALAGREFPQILLLHANELNADLMPELLAMFRRRGYEFVTLEEALADEVYRSPEDYVGRGGFSWIHRWTRTKGLPITAEPEPPAWVAEAYAAP
jgi:peptidoglycan/xylan/chitin deacetylase (PgdA/CDA1 family)